MMFDKNKVLERIISEVPILSNKRGELTINNDIKENDKLVKIEVKVPIYAYYFNRGLKDPDLDYDKVNSPIATTKDSSLAEVYSLFDSGKFQKEYRGPDVVSFGGTILLDNNKVIKYIRDNYYNFEFFHSAFKFKNHFNRIVEDLGYDINFLNLGEGIFKFGTYGVQSSREIIYSFGKKEAKEGKVNVIVPLKLNLNKNDPSLLEVLDLIEASYSKIKNADILNSPFILMDS